MRGHFPAVGLANAVGQMRPVVNDSQIRQTFFGRLVSAAVVFVFAAAAFAETLPVRSFTSADGLGSSFVSCLMRDSRGFLWICTRDGLSRFDGRTFINYQVGEKDAPPGIENVYETREGFYWITTTGGLYRFDGRSGQSFPSATDGERPILNAEFVGRNRGGFYQDRSGTLWYFGSSLSQVVERDGRFALEELSLSLPENPEVQFDIKAIAEGGQEGIWLLTTWGPVHRLPDGRSIFYRARAAADPVHSMAVDSGGRVWIARRSSIFALMPESGAEVEPTGGVTVRDIDDHAVLQSFSRPKLPSEPGEIFKFEGFEDDTTKFLYKTSDGHVWISAKENLIEFNGWEFHVYAASQGMSVGNGRMVEDLRGNLWVGGSKGLIRLDRHGLTTYRIEDGLVNPNVMIFVAGLDGTLYCASGDFFINKFDGKKFESVRPRLDANSRAEWASKPVLLDSQNEWWLLPKTKLYRIASTHQHKLLAERAPIATYTRGDGLKGDQMFHAFEDKDGDVWIGTRAENSAGFGLTKWSRATDRFYTFSEAENFPARKSVSAMAQDPIGNVWVGFYEGGLVRYSNGRFEEITVDGNLLDGVITALHFDRNGKLWFTTAFNGLNRIDDLTSTHPAVMTYRTENGLASNNARSITEDGFGRIYVGTARGVDRITPESGRIKHFSISDGLAGDFVQAAFRDGRGTLWFGTPNGISRLEPREELQAEPPRVWISRLRIAGENRPVSELGTSELATGELEPEQSNLQIDFFGIDFDPNASLRFQYLLEGADREWSQPTEQRTVNFSNLSAGTYRFMVRGVNADGVVSLQPAAVSFIILPPIWQRWWFVSLAILTAAIIFAGFYKYRIMQLTRVNEALMQVQKSREERLAELDRVRSRIARDLHDDVGSSLTQIALYSEVAKQREKEKASAEEPLEFLVNTSNELVDAMSDIVWAINPRKDHLNDLTQRMRHYASEVLTFADIDLEFSAPAIDQEVALGANLRREVFLIFKESVNNIVKHSNAGAVRIDFRIESDSLILTLKDDGGGFDPAGNGSEPFDWEKARGGNGIPSMKRRAEDLGGAYGIESNIGNGTVAILNIPLGRNSKT